MRIIDPFLAELDQESKTTRKFLEALPEDQLGFRPHEKSMTAGELAWHVATLPGVMAEWGASDVFEMSGGEKESTQHTKAEILSAFEGSLAKARDILGGFDDAKATATWTFKMNGHTLMSMPRIAMVRGFMYNHLYHHRGQLGVYLRLTEAKVPASYGPSADENPIQHLMEAAAQG